MRPNWPCFTTAGKSKRSGDRLVFKNANSLILILAARTNFVQDRSKGWKGELPHAAVTARIDAARKRSWEELLAEHVRDYQSLFQRVAIDLGPGGDASLPTDVRLANLCARKRRRIRDSNRYCSSMAAT